MGPAYPLEMPGLVWLVGILVVWWNFWWLMCTKRLHLITVSPSTSKLAESHGCDRWISLINVFPNRWCWLFYHLHILAKCNAWLPSFPRNESLRRCGLMSAIRCSIVTSTLCNILQENGTLTSFIWKATLKRRKMDVYCIKKSCLFLDPDKYYKSTREAKLESRTVSGEFYFQRQGRMLSDQDKCNQKKSCAFSSHPMHLR